VGIILYKLLIHRGKDGPDQQDPAYPFTQTHRDLPVLAKQKLK